MYRDAERQFKSAIADQPMVDSYLYLAKVYIRMDQPLAAIDVYKQGLVKFPQEVSLLLGQARVHEVPPPLLLLLLLLLLLPLYYCMVKMLFFILFDANIAIGEGLRCQLCCAGSVTLMHVIQV